MVLFGVWGNLLLATLVAKKRPPLVPTSLLPGSDAKIRLLRDRAESRQPLHHPSDAKLPLGVGYLLVDTGNGLSKIAAMVAETSEGVQVVEKRTQNDPKTSEVSMHWLATMPDGREFKLSGDIRTKSEARSVLKAELGLKRRQGLPAGTKLKLIV